MNGKPTAAQKRFHRWAVHQWGCVVSGLNAECLHHIKGARMKLKGVKGFAGEWYILPLTYYWHQDGENPNAIHPNRKAFEGLTGFTEKELWIGLIDGYETEFDKKPMSEEEYQIIVERA